jgi:hypothetical protein
MTYKEACLERKKMATGLSSSKSTVSLTSQFNLSIGYLCLPHNSSMTLKLQFLEK